ncbi:MAG: hypothetical protein SPG66_06155 [Anaerovibrio sp.]|nr:hypothetical protein [Anaerovibrio sp.]
MWFLTQAEYVEILEPAWFRESMRESIEKMMNHYLEK